MRLFSRYGYRRWILRAAAGIIDCFGGMFFFWLRRNILAERNLATKVRSILVVKLDHLGDAFLLTPLFSGLKEKFPNALISCVCLPASRPIFENNPAIHRILTFRYARSIRSASEKPDSIFKLLQLFRESKPDLFIDPRGDFWIAFLGFFSRAHRRIGFRAEEPGAFFYHQSLPLIPGEPEVLRNLRILGEGHDRLLPTIHATEEEKTRVRETTSTLKNRILLGIHPGAGFAYKKWPLERMAELLQRIQRTFPEIRIFIFGEKKERVECDELIRQSGLTASTVSNECGRWTIRESFVLVGQMNAFLANDSVLAHFASSQNVGLLELMNSTVDATRWRAFGTKTEVLVGVDPAHRCARSGCTYPCPNMSSLSSDLVWERLRLILEKISAGMKQGPT